nr:PRTRC system protein F [uncultured Massilia sp.]
MLPAAALALPAFSPEVPMQYTLPGASALAVPLVIALLEADVVTEAMLRTPRNAPLAEVFGETEKQLAERALAHWWTKLIRTTPCKFFRWELHVQQLEHPGWNPPYGSSIAWFCFTRIRHQEQYPQRFALSAGVEKLEKLMEGFGQTVLDVLYDATRLLPDSLCPWHAVDWMERTCWDDNENDAELLENKRIEGGYATVADLVEHEHIVTRGMFYAEIPEWVGLPKRTRTRAEIDAAATTKFSREVVAVCDALHQLVNQPDFVLRPEDKGTYRCGYESIDASMILLWKPHDAISQALDDYLNDLGNCGEYCEFIDANPVEMTAAGVRDFMTKTEQAIQVAVLTEKLVLLLGEKF